MLVLTLLFCALLNSCHGLDNGLALTPPMGWMSWCLGECDRTIDCKQYPDKCISANLIKRTADRLVSDGYLDAGYEYLVIDECWLENTRAPDGHLVADRERFPLGMKDVADYVHSKGLKFGLHYSCISYPEVMDTIVEWDLDYVKLSASYGSYGKNVDEDYKVFGTLLNNTGRDILYSCVWPAQLEIQRNQPNYEVAAATCNTWRNWLKSTKDVSHVIDWYGYNGARLAKHAGPGHWNDPDTLIIANYGMSKDQAKVQMAVWAILAAPLFMETDLGTIKSEHKRILLNRDIIGVNQDALGKQGLRILQRSQIDVWRRELHDGSVAIAFVNRRESGAPYTANFTHADLQLPEQTYDVMDLYHEDELGVLCETCNFVTQVKSTGVKFYKFTKRALVQCEHHYISIFMEEMRNNPLLQNSRIDKLQNTLESSLKDMNSLKRATPIPANKPSIITKQESRFNKLETTIESSLKNINSLMEDMRTFISKNQIINSKQESRISKLENTVESSLKNMNSLMKEMKTLISNNLSINTKQESRIKTVETTVESSLKNMNSLMEEMRTLISNNSSITTKQESRINKLETTVGSSLKNMSSLMEEMRTLIPNNVNICTEHESRINKLETSVESSLKLITLLPTNSHILNSRVNTLESTVESSRNDFKHQNEVILQKIEHVHDNLLKITSMLTSS